MEKKSEIIIKDIPLSRLEPTSPNIKDRELAGIRMSMEGVGMLEPLVVCAKGEVFQISDGNKRYRILCDEGFESAPCVVTSLFDTYTASRQVIDVSHIERQKMIDKVSETVPEDKIAAAIGKQTLKPTIDKNLEDKLHAVVKTAYEGRRLSKAALHELKKVSLKRQAEIMKELKQIKTYNLGMIIAKILQTPKAEIVAQGKEHPLTRNNEKRDQMTKQLREVSDEGLFMERQYNIYASDVIKLLVYIRGFFDNEAIRKYVEKEYLAMYKKFRAIMDRE